MTPETMMALALGDGGVVAKCGVPAGTEGAIQVVALGRHKVDGVVVVTGQSYWLPRERAEAAIARDIVHPMGAANLDWYGRDGRVLSPWKGDEERVHSRAASPGSLRIAQGCSYDPGNAAYRFHSALNAHTKHASVFTRYLDNNPYCSLRQLDGVKDAPLVRESLLQADVLHCHMNYLLSANATSLTLKEGDPRSARPVQWTPGQWIVRHYHGSRPDGRTNLEHGVDDKVRLRAQIDGGGLIRVGARLTICAEPDAQDLQWLPITIPVVRYAALRAPRAHGARPFRIAHSPTKRAYKGTDKFMAAVRRLQGRGVPVEAVLIEGKEHGAALELKATCDATFDSLWLGIQGSGLEGGAMGMPCIAGDADVAALYKQHVGYVPYTFAADEFGIENAVRRLVDDPAFYQAEAERCAGYVAKYHDYPSVAARYEQILATAMNRTDILTGEESHSGTSLGETGETDSPVNTSPRRKRGKVAA